MVNLSLKLVKTKFGKKNENPENLSQDFPFISQFGKEILKLPRDVKPTKEYIFIFTAPVRQ